jgi:hypothetical protein
MDATRPAGFGDASHLRNRPVVSRIHRHGSGRSAGKFHERNSVHKELRNAMDPKLTTGGAM